MILASCAPFGRRRRRLLASLLYTNHHPQDQLRVLLELSPHPRDTVSEAVARTARRWGAFTRHQGLEDTLVSRVVAKTAVPSGAVFSTKTGSMGMQLLTPADYSGLRSNCGSVRHHVRNGGFWPEVFARFRLGSCVWACYNFGFSLWVVSTPPVLFLPRLANRVADRFPPIVRIASLVIVASRSCTFFFSWDMLHVLSASSPRLLDRIRLDLVGSRNVARYLLSPV
ncbi:hypothetical protein DFH09DRAFT_1269445 [Mycena vulgaris]|nr:hypothetical protein DFH09DRAFT_1269445 [Mycena vulgaris]